MNTEEHNCQAHAMSSAKVGAKIPSENGRKRATLWRHPHRERGVVNVSSLESKGYAPLVGRDRKQSKQGLYRGTGGDPLPAPSPALILTEPEQGEGSAGRVRT